MKMRENQSNKPLLGRRWVPGILVLIAGALASSPAFAESLAALSGHIPQQIQSATLLGRAPVDEQVQLSLVVRLDQSLLDQTLDQLYGSNAPAVKHYLSSSEFAQTFGLADKRQMLKDFAKANGLIINSSEDEPKSMVIKVAGPAAIVEKAFHVQLNHYRAADGQVFRAHATEPMIPSSLTPHLGAVLGLSNMTGVFRPHIRMAPASRAASVPALVGTTGQLGGLSPSDIKSIYGLSSIALTGTGQTVALVEFDGYIASDITGYETAYSLPSVSLANVSVDGTGNNPSGTNGQVEVTLDIEMVAALAPGISKMLIYQAPNNQQGGFDLNDKIATDDMAQITSTSWGYPEDVAATLKVVSGVVVSSFTQAENQIFQRMAAQGQSMYAASGDSGAFDDPNNPTVPVVDDPACQPFVTGVGGTSLSGSVASPVETAWNNGSGASGGGVSTVWPISSTTTLAYSYQVGYPGRLLK